MALGFGGAKKGRPAKPEVKRVKRDPMTWKPSNLYVEGKPPLFPCYGSYAHYTDDDMPVGDWLCYPFAFVYAQRSGGVIVHGTVFGGLEQKRLPHAWVLVGHKVTDNLIFRDQGFIDKDRYYRTYKAVEDARYLPGELMDLCEFYQHYGPFPEDWEDELKDAGF